MPYGSLPSLESFLALVRISEFSLAFLSILLNLAMVITLAFIEAIFWFYWTFYSSFISVIILAKSTSLLYLLIFILSLVALIAVFLVRRWSIISPILSDKNGSDHENKSRPLGKLNGYSTSLYYLIFILSFSIRITAPLFL